MRLEDEIKYSELDWECIWQKSLKKGFKKEKDWDKIATEYGKWLENDDYPDVLLNEMKLSSNDTVLDIGCAEGTITRKIAKKAKSITGIDKSKLMLEELNRKAADEGLSNVKTIQKDINDLTYGSIGDYDIVLASRCLNGIYNIKDTLITLNEIANKYVYITVFGSSTHKYKKEKAEIAGKPFKAGTDHMVLVMLLRSLGIEANVLQLECEKLKEYHSIEEAIERSIWRLGELEEENRIALENYFKDIFVKNERGNWVNPKDKTDLVLIWWKKDE
ncbi:MAG: class I SAM-dependent methyltransferase [Methanobrevibacter ruminantium]|uniref:class I SAM-dependent methyltransferase n=1 Tax=Methanobrevibacter ruminantium TaxID=83816 RepID=UPI0026E9CA26|nr:class I SAM-dependent methyltransferase [Methanobrevibacter ruminantium]MDD6048028.1 class I SAM-dependent methyltransferase [Methanobrevibacter ruminantium]